MSIKDNIVRTRWTRADALKVQFDDSATTSLPISSDFPVMHDDLFVWDIMVLRGMDGVVRSVDRWSVIFTLTAKKLPEKYKDKEGNYDIVADWDDRHRRAKICYWYSRDSKHWTYGGPVMKDGVSPMGTEGSGSAIIDDETKVVTLYYTAINPGSTISKVEGQIETSKEGIKLVGFDKVSSLLEADGVYYQTEKQSAYWNFSDPHPFHNVYDPYDTNLYMLFAANVAGKFGSHSVTRDDIGDVPPGHIVPESAKFYSGCVGFAVCREAENKWEMLPPLITAVGVNGKTEHPNIIFKEGKYYIFIVTGQEEFATGLAGPDGLYGFMSSWLFGPYVPLNGSGLVLGNPSSQPHQSYAHYVMQSVDSDPMLLITNYEQNRNPGVC